MSTTTTTRYGLQENDGTLELWDSRADAEQAYKEYGKDDGLTLVKVKQLVTTLVQ